MNRAEELALILKPPVVNRTASIVGSRNLFSSTRPDSPRQLDQRSGPVEIPIMRQDSNPSASQSVVDRSLGSSPSAYSSLPVEVPISRQRSSDSWQESLNTGMTSIDFQQAVSNQNIQALSKQTPLNSASRKP